MGALGLALCAVCAACGSIESDNIEANGGTSSGGTMAVPAGGSAGLVMTAAGSAGTAMTAGGSGGTAMAEPSAGAAGQGMGAAGTASIPDQPPDEPPCDAFTEVFQASCATGGGCHNAIGVGNFALSEERAEAYVGATPTFNAVGDLCGLMIDPESPERSMILTKVTGEPPYDSFDCGEPMPTNGSVTDEQVECLRSWLEQFRE